MRAGCLFVEVSLIWLDEGERQGIATTRNVGRHGTSGDTERQATQRVAASGGGAQLGSVCRFGFRYLWVD